LNIKEIYCESEKMLRTEAGKNKIKHVMGVLKTMAEASPTLAELRLKIKKRPLVDFYINCGNARDNNKLKISVRASGVECGYVIVDANGSRIFTPKNTKHFGDSWRKFNGTNKNELWEKTRVAKYISEVHSIRREKKLRPESFTECALIKELNKHTGNNKEEQLLNRQPILFPASKEYTGFPFQMLMPLSGLNGNFKCGHIDVLGIRRRGNSYEIEIFEVKAPGVSPSASVAALKQGAIYGSALSHMLNNYPEYEKYFGELYGKRNLLSKKIRISAVVPYTEKTSEKMKATINELNNEKGIFQFSALLYDAQKTDPTNREKYFTVYQTI